MGPARSGMNREAVVIDVEQVLYKWEGGKGDGIHRPNPPISYWVMLLRTGATTLLGGKLLITIECRVRRSTYSAKAGPKWAQHALV